MDAVGPGDAAAAWGGGGVDESNGVTGTDVGAAGAAETGAGAEAGSRAADRVVIVRRVGASDEGLLSAGAAATGAGVRVVGGAAGCSTGLAGVPGRLKFCSSRGPIAVDEGALVEASGTACASAAAGISPNPAADRNLPRKPALIRSCSVLGRRSPTAAFGGNACPLSRIQAQAG
jgi:hypothetical protein